MGYRKQIKGRKNTIPSLGNKVIASEQIVNDYLPGEFALLLVNHLQQEILKASGKTQNPSEALLRAYGMLCDEQKIDFLLAGGVAQLLRYQRHIWQRSQQGCTGKFSSDPATGSLPVMC